MGTKQRGFTLIELMTVVAVLGIVMAIAIPTYLNYTVRARVSEGLSLIAPAKLAVQIARQERLEPPYTNARLGLPVPASIRSENVASVTVTASGTITVAYSDIPGGDLEGLAVQFVPNWVDGSLSFQCNGPGTTVRVQHLPANCRSD